MDTKLTLKLDKEVIHQAKLYAEAKKISLSKLIESYLQVLTTQQPAKGEISTLVDSLSGVIDLPVNGNGKDDYADFLTKKYE